MNMRVDAAKNLDNLDLETRVYDQEFFDRLTRPSSPEAINESSETTGLYVLAKKELRDLELHEAFDVFATKAGNQSVLKSFLENLDYVQDNMHDLREGGKMGSALNATFDAAIESLVRADWQKLQKDGADWNRICAALSYGLGTTAELLGVGAEVTAHIEDWRKFYLTHGMSLSQQRELRVRLNAEALEHHKNLAYTSMQREKGDVRVENVMNDIKGQLNVVQQQIDAMGVDPDERYAGAFTRNAQIAKVREEGKQPQTQQDAPVQSPWVSTPKKEEQPKGLFGKLGSVAKKVAGWFKF